MSAPVTKPELMTRGEVASLFGVHEATVSRWASTGRIQSVRTPGGHHRYRRDDIDALLGGSCESGHRVAVELVTAELRAVHPGIASDARYALVERRNNRVVAVPETADANSRGFLMAVAEPYAKQVGAVYQAPETAGGAR